MTAKINGNYDKLKPSYLFSEIGRRTREFSEANPRARIIRLGIGDTTQPLPQVFVTDIKETADMLGDSEGYKKIGHYGDEQGMSVLREAISNDYKQRGITVDPSEIFCNDGAKSDLGNIQSIFDLETKVAIQDPVYPAYRDVTVINGRAGEFDPTTGRYSDLVYMACTPSNNFFPELPDRKAGLIYLCSPNNPTGATMNKNQLKTFVDFAIDNKSVIIFDAAYSAFISDPNLPKSIYEIEGAKKCAIEVQSFSKSDGFTGLRLGWTVVPKEIECEDGGVGKLNQLWNRRQTTFFNGPSNVAQRSGLIALSPEGKAEDQKIVDYYKTNARIIREGLSAMGLETFGGENAPYVWLKTPNGMDSWEFFDKCLKGPHVVGTPGSGFGLFGEGYFRFSGFGSRNDTEEAIQMMQTELKI